MIVPPVARKDITAEQMAALRNGRYRPRRH
jgi:hypothetical protein